MKAFFSGTDNDLLKEMGETNDFFYPSIICADSDEPWAFAVSYKDQYGNVQKMTGDDPVEKVQIPKDEWAKETFSFVEKFIKEEKKKVPQQTFFNTGFYSHNRVTPTGKWSNQHQAFIHTPNNEETSEPDEKTFDRMTEGFESKRKLIIEKHNKGEITDEMFDEESERIDGEEEALYAKMFGGIE